MTFQPTARQMRDEASFVLAELIEHDLPVFQTALARTQRAYQHVVERATKINERLRDAQMIEDDARFARRVTS